MRALIRRLVLEALETHHFVDRVRERLHDPERISPPLDPTHIDGAIALLRKVNFPKNVSVSVNVFRSKVAYTSRTSDKPEPTKGNNVWVVIRGNNLITVYFRGEAMPTDTNYQITIANVWSLIDEKGSYDVTQQDLDRIVQKQRSVEPRKRGKEINLPLVLIRGTKWYADVDNNRFIYAKNIHKTMSFDDAFNTLPEEELDAILAQLPSAPALA